MNEERKLIIKLIEEAEAANAFAEQDLKRINELESNAADWRRASKAHADQINMLNTEIANLRERALGVMADEAKRKFNALCAAQADETKRKFNALCAALALGRNATDSQLASAVVRSFYDQGAHGEKINMIFVLRTLIPGMGLKDAKDAIEATK